jgi:DNA anti-recombination protein RmuC
MTGTQWLIVGWITALYVIDWILRHRASRAGTVDHTLHHRLLRSELHSLAVSVAAEFHAARKERESLMSLGQEIISELKELKALSADENTEVQEKITALEARLAAETVSEEERGEITALIGELKQQIAGISEPATPEAAPTTDATE